MPNRKPAATAAAFPPAPTIPLTLPTAFLFTNGTMAYTAPHDMHTNRPNTTNAISIGTSAYMRANTIMLSPSSSTTANSHRARLFSPPAPRLSLSDTNPPIPRANRFSPPKLSAAHPAATSPILNASWKYRWAMLSIVSSMPKHDP